MLLLIKHSQHYVWYVDGGTPYVGGGLYVYHKLCKYVCTVYTFVHMYVHVYTHAHTYHIQYIHTYIRKYIHT